MHVLVTRPEEDSRRTVEKLQGLGIDTSVAPLLTVVLETIGPAAIESAAAIIATSRNGVRALAASEAALKAVIHLPIFVVGGGTEEIARAAGFKSVIRGPGRASELAPVVASHLKPQAGSVAVLIGDVVAFDTVAAITQMGFTAERISAYRSVPAASLPPAVVGLLKSGKIDSVLLMSPRTAVIWDKLIQSEQPSAAAVIHICLSQEVAEALQPLPGRGKVCVAAHPSLQAILTLTKRLAHDL